MLKNIKFLLIALMTFVGTANAADLSTLTDAEAIDALCAKMKLVSGKLRAAELVDGAGKTDYEADELEGEFAPADGVDQAFLTAFLGSIGGPIASLADADIDAACVARKDYLSYGAHFDYVAQLMEDNNLRAENVHGTLVLTSDVATKNRAATAGVAAAENANAKVFAKLLGVANLDAATGDVKAHYYGFTRNILAYRAAGIAAADEPNGAGIAPGALTFGDVLGILAGVAVADGVTVTKATADASVFATKL